MPRYLKSSSVNFLVNVGGGLKGMGLPISLQHTWYSGVFLSVLKMSVCVAYRAWKASDVPSVRVSATSIAKDSLYWDFASRPYEQDTDMNITVKYAAARLPVSIGSLPPLLVSHHPYSQWTPAELLILTSSSRLFSKDQRDAFAVISKCFWLNWLSAYATYSKTFICLNTGSSGSFFVQEFLQFLNPSLLQSTTCSAAE